MEDTYLNKLKQFYFDNFYIPSYEEMCKLFNVSSKHAVTYWVNIWKEQGLIMSVKEKLMPTDAFFEFPVLGTIQAGIPSEGHTMQETLMLHPFNFKNPAYTYLLKVRGDSMIGAGIIEGDLVVLDKKLEPRNGSVVAALVDGEWTLKYYRTKNGQVYLQAANDKYPNIHPKEQLEIGGVVIKVIREYTN